MAISIQSIVRRISRILAYGISGLLVWRFGSVGGVRADIVVSIVLILLAVVMQVRYMKTASRDGKIAIHRPRHLLRKFPTDLKRLLASDIFARWAEGLAKPFIILFCIPILSSDLAKGTALYQSLLLNIEAVVNIILYLVIGPLASREGLAKKPFIGLTILFFGLFPLSLAVLGPTLGTLGLALAFVVGGMREIGEPARKAMVAELVPQNMKTQSIGLYWSARSVGVMWASPVGALAWILGDRVSPGVGPLATFALAGIAGLAGAVLFYTRFGRS
jgi:MFS family permease